MKKVLITLAMIASVMTGYAQPRGGAQAALAAIDAAKATANKKADKPANWIKLGEAYLAAYSASVGDGWVGATPQDLQLIMARQRARSEEQVQIAGANYRKADYGLYSYYYDENGNLAAIESTNPVVPNALDLAVEAYKKAASVDAKGAKAKDIAAGLASVASKYTDDAYSAYKLNKSELASTLFEKAANATIGKVDAEMLYNAGFTAFDAAQYDRAKDFFTKCLDMEYFGKNGDVYSKLGDTYGKLGEKALMKETLESAFAKYPESQNILVGLINYYLEENENPERLFELIRTAEANDPKNASLYYVEGNINYQLGRIEDAVTCYRKSGDVNPAYEFGYIGEGVMYYELAVDAQEKAQAELDDAKYAVLAEQFENYLKACIEPFEKGFEVTKDNELKVNIAEYLKNACFRFRDDAAYQAKYDVYAKVVSEGL